MRNIFTTIGIVAAVITASIHSKSRASIPDDFVNAPKDIVTTIDSLTRVEMLLYHQAGSTTPSKNTLGGTSRIISLTPQAITFSTSSASETTIAMLPSKSDSILLVINTVAIPTLDSDAALYSRAWQLLPSKKQLPSVNNLDLWLTPEGKKHRTEVENAVPFMTAKYSYDPESLTLTAVSTVRRLINKDNYEPVDPYLKPSIQYKWTGSRWTLIKD